MERYLIGTSLSMCLADIVRGRVREENVALIVTGTKYSFEPEPDWSEINVGSRLPMESTEKEILHRLWKQGRIHQPREVSPWYEENHGEPCLPC